LFLEKTGNEWEDHRHGKLVKQAGKFYPVDVDYGSSSDSDAGGGNGLPSLGLSAIGGGRSRLDPRVQELIRVIFDVKEMQRVMLEMEIDTRKMPLGN